MSRFHRHTLRPADGGCAAIARGRFRAEALPRGSSRNQPKGTVRASPRSLGRAKEILGSIVTPTARRSVDSAFQPSPMLRIIGPV